MKTKIKKTFSLLLTTLIFTNFVNATENEIFHLSWLTDSLIAGTALALDATDIILDKVVHFGNTDFSLTSFDIQNVNAFDSLFAHPYNRTIDISSDCIVFVSLLVPSVMLSTVSSQWFTIGNMYMETLLWAFGLKELLKMSVGRARPYMYFPDYPEKEVEKGDWNNSFPSGHTTYAFAAATFATYVFCSYFPSSAWRFAVGFGSYAVAATVATLRVLGGCHFVTDVIAGAAIGTTCGLLIPFLHTLGESSTGENTASNNKNGEIRVSQNVGVRISPLRLDIVARF